MKRLIWDDITEELLRKWWSEDGLSGGMIAQRFESYGYITRSAILGKVHRMRLPKRQEQFQSQRVNGKALQRTAFGKPFRPAPRNNPLVPRGLPRTAKPQASGIDPAKIFKSPSPVKFDDLLDHHCRWVETNENQTSTYCGCQVVPGTSWCVDHYKVVFLDPSRPRPVRIIRPHYRKVLVTS